VAEAYIVDAVRTAVGKRVGGFAGEHPADMAAHVIGTVAGRHDLDPAAVNDVILGCLDNIGSQAGDIARAAALAAGPPESVPGVTVAANAGPHSRRCISAPRP
jgi:acetyl-CoA C-acetyltransferase